MLHVVRWRAGELDPLLDDIAANGYGLTLGIHSRIDDTAEQIVARLANGNVYVNRNMIGAVVGTQPFGGSGSLRHRAEGGRAELPATFRHRAGRHGEHLGGGRQRQPAGGRRVEGAAPQASSHCDANYRLQTLRFCHSSTCDARSIRIQWNSAIVRNVDD